LLAKYSFLFKSSSEIYGLAFPMTGVSKSEGGSFVNSLNLE